MLTCHCRDCQQITGTGHARSMGVSRRQVAWTGSESTQHYTLLSNWGNDVDTHFCGNCGSPVYKWTGTLAEDIFFFHAGLFDDESIDKFEPTVEIWMHAKPAWDNLV